MGRIEKLKRQAIHEANIRVLNEQEGSNMVIEGGTPIEVKKHELGFFGINYLPNSTIKSVINSYMVGGIPKSEESRNHQRVTTPSQILFAWYGLWTPALGSIRFNLIVESEDGKKVNNSVGLRRVVEVDTYYKGTWEVHNLPIGTAIKIYVEGDEKNNLVIKTSQPATCEEEWVIIEKDLERALNNNTSIDIKPYICKKDQTESIKKQIPGIDDGKIECLLSKVKSWCKKIKRNNMSRLEKLKRQAIHEANIRVLNEQSTDGGEYEKGMDAWLTYLKEVVLPNKNAAFKDSFANSLKSIEQFESRDKHASEIEAASTGFKELPYTEYKIENSEHTKDSDDKYKPLPPQIRREYTIDLPDGTYGESYDDDDGVLNTIYKFDIGDVETPGGKSTGYRIIMDGSISRSGIGEVVIKNKKIWDDADYPLNDQIYKVLKK